MFLLVIVITPVFDYCIAVVVVRRGNSVSTTKPKEVIKSTYEYDRERNNIDDMKTKSD